MSIPGGPGATVPRGTRSACGQRVEAEHACHRGIAQPREQVVHGPRLVVRGLELARAGRERGEIRRLRRGKAVQHVRVGAEHLTVQIEAGEGELRAAASQERPERRALVEPVGEDAAALEVAERQGRHLRKQVEERRVHLPVEPGARASEIGHGEGHHQGRGRTRPEHAPAHGPGHRRHHNREQQHEGRVAPRHLDQPRPEGLEDARPRRPGRGARPSARRRPPAPPRPRRPPTPANRAHARLATRSRSTPKPEARATAKCGSSSALAGKRNDDARGSLATSDARPPRSPSAYHRPRAASPSTTKRGRRGSAKAPRAARARVRGPK